MNSTTEMEKNLSTIPLGWQLKKISDLCQVFKGQGLSKDQVDVNGTRKCLLYGELFTTYREIISEVKSRTSIDEGVSSQDGDVLMPGSTTTVARDLAVASALHENNVLLGGDINILRKKNGLQYDPDFLAYYLTHYKKQEISRVAQGTTIIHLYGSGLKDIEITIPKKIEEQKKIARILMTVDQQIQKIDAIIVATEKLKKGLMRQLFSRGIGHTKFKKTKIGEIPVEWDLLTIKDSSIKLIDGDRGVNYPKQNDFTTEGFCLFLSAKNVTKEGFVFNKSIFISKEKDAALRKGKLQREDIILTTRGTVGNVAFFDEGVPYDNVRINSGMLIFRHGDQYDPTFLYQYLVGPQMKAMYLSMGSGSAQPQLPIKSLEQIKIPVVPINEQKQIASVISAVYGKLDINSKLREKLILLKRGLVLDLLSGKKKTI